MKKLIYLCPALFCFALGGLFYITTERFADAEMPKAMIALPTTIEATITIFFNFLIVRILNERNAARLVITGGAMLVLCSILFILFDDLYLQLVWMGVLGISFCFYCAPFQLFMKMVERDAAVGVARAAGKYTGAWSFGFACGPMVFSMFSARTGFIVCALAGILIALIVVAALRYLSSQPEIVPVMQENSSVQPAADCPDLAWVGWVVSGVGLLTVCMLRTMWQPYGKELKLSDQNIAYVLALISYAQGIMAFILANSKKWMFRVVPVILMGLMGVASMLCFWLGKSMSVFYAAALIYGIYSGCYYFVLVYYSLIHPVKAARNAGLNEVVVGGLGAPGPVIIGAIAQYTGISFLFGFFAAAVAVATLIHALAIMKLCSGKSVGGI